MIPYSKFSLFLLAFLLNFSSCKNVESENTSEENSKVTSEKSEQSFHEQMMIEIEKIEVREDLASTEGMIMLEGGTYTMGGNSRQARQDEFPQHQETIKDLWVDKTEVTNAEFRKFIEATGYLTTAEREFELDGKTYAPGAMVFDPENPEAWWKFIEGANWKHPEGPKSTIKNKDDLPVVQISWYDAMAYAKWAGKRLPTEAEFEYLARGGRDKQVYHWGDDFSVAAEFVNFHQGDFPVSNSQDDSFENASPVKSFPANDFGLYDMAGNVWEWCLDTYYPNAYSKLESRTDGYFREYFNAEQHKVIRGGSFLCSESYCTGYRNSARMSSTPDSSLEHLGFRCVKDI
ncbi:formylglycine-generating enzyme family protein [Salegentibacter sediminis]|uniref:formylglycine-generating enzyme family protein n=1 Tax=Salegentibacter sediminis TaxID=1930251 RepID=UPI000DA14902|nr:formylglycine-generating enzyme family protein [Salegentibacter sediminis]